MTVPIAITMGDPCGIGPEIAAQLFASSLPWPALVVGDVGVMRRAVKLLGLDLHVEAADAAGCCDRSGTIPVLPVSDLPPDLPVGRVDARAGRASYDYVTRAIDEALAGRTAGIVTGPINKEALKAGGVDYPGHTEILADRSGGCEVAMMLGNDELRVILVSIHVSLREALDFVTTPAVLRTIRFANMICRSFGVTAPRVAVAGLNPHAGENGRFGREDIDILRPAVDQARAEGIDASGPWPPDTIFMRARAGAFDIVVAQYHDQGLIPVKYLGIEHGVNVTVGLPYVRTSVDHGTAFDIAWTGKASASSLRYAYDQALKLVANRKETVR